MGLSGSWDKMSIFHLHIFTFSVINTISTAVATVVFITMLLLLLLFYHHYYGQYRYYYYYYD